MADKTLSSIIGGDGGLIMPQLQAPDGFALSIKVSNSNNRASSDVNFWNAVSTGRPEQGYDTAVLSATANTSEQEVMNETGEGVLTHVVAPALSATGVMVIKVVADGVTTLFTSNSLTGADIARLCIGSYSVWTGQTQVNDVTGLGGFGDVGFTSIPRMVMPTPNQAIQVGGIGIKFESTCVVTIQGSVNITSTAEMLKAYAGWVTSIPEGL